MIKTYSGHLTFSQCDNEQLMHLEAAASKWLSGAAVSISTTYIDVDFFGKDSGENIVKFLREAAQIIVDATGEVECSIPNEASKYVADKLFTFYSVKDGRLFRQAGWTCRSEDTSEEVTI